MSDSELSTDEAAEALEKKGTDVSPGELRRLAREDRIPARKEAGEWVFDARILASDRVETALEEEQGGGDPTTDLDARLDEAVEQGREQAERDSGESTDRIFTDPIE